MKKWLLSLGVLVSLSLTSCLEITQEITVNENGSGILSNTNDMSALIGMAKQMGGNEALSKADDKKVDTTVSLAAGVDSIGNLTAAEKEIVKKGSLYIKMNMKEEKFITRLSFPFSNPSEIPALDKLSAKVMDESMKNQMGKNPMMDQELEKGPAPSSINDYYILNFSDGSLVKSLNKEKYATASSDEYLKSMQEAASMGIPMKATYVINLPRPAKKAEGKGIKLSDDKKKITIETDIDDFFENPSKLEYKIEY